MSRESDAIIIRRHYGLKRKVTPEEVESEIKNLIRKSRLGFLDSSQEHLYAALDIGTRFPGSSYQSNPAMHGLKIIATNMMEVQHGPNRVLYSYETPVAILAPSGLWATETHFSATTEKHINKWFRSHGVDWKGAQRVSQQDIALAAQQGTDPTDILKLRGLSKQMTKPRRPGHQPNPSKFGDVIEEMLYHIDHDQTIGSVDELGWYGLVSGLTLPEATEFVIRSDVDPGAFGVESKNYDWPLNAVISEDSHGFISVVTFKENRQAIRFWREIEKRYARYYGVE